MMVPVPLAVETGSACSAAIVSLKQLLWKLAVKETPTGQNLCTTTLTVDERITESATGSDDATPSRQSTTTKSKAAGNSFTACRFRFFECSFEFPQAPTIMYMRGCIALIAALQVQIATANLNAQPTTTTWQHLKASDPASAPMDGQPCGPTPNTGTPWPAAVRRMNACFPHSPQCCAVLPRHALRPRSFFV